MLSIPGAARALYLRTPAVLRGIAFWVMATILFACMQAMVRAVSQDVHPLVVVFFRTVFGLFVFVPWLVDRRLPALRTRRLGLLTLRAALWVIAMALYFYALKLTPLAKVVALEFTGPLIATVLAIFILGERIRIRRITALVVGFSGIMVILRPGMVEVDLGSLLVLISVVFWGFAMIVVKVLARTETSATITLYMTLLAIPFTLVAALFVWQMPSWQQLGWLAVIGILGNMGHLCFNQAFREAEITAIVPFDFMRLIWAALLGYLFFAETPHVSTWIGAVMIFSAVVYITYREAKAQDEETAGTEGGR